MQKRRFIMILVSLAAVSAWSADHPADKTKPVPSKKHCIGYTIIEYGKGINCNGDTVVLEKKGGLQVLALENHLHGNRN